MRVVPLISLFAILSAALAAEEGAVLPGSILLASGEGLSVFDRDGAMKFGRFFVPVADGKGEPTPWSDIAYDGCRMTSGNYLCSSHEWVREIAPDGKIIREYRVRKPVELKTCVPLPNGDVVTTDASSQELLRLALPRRQRERRSAF